MLKKRRRNFLPTFMLILLLWTSWFYLLFFVNPESLRDMLIPDIYLPFLLNLFLALFFTLSLLLKDKQQGFTLSTGVIIFLLLRLYQIANFLNILLLLATIFLLEFYLAERKLS